MSLDNHKKERIDKVRLTYYSRKDVREFIFKFSKNRECVPKYFESFGKRPGIFQYESDILEYVKKGATSFHCSEELWEDPLELSPSLSQQQLNDLRIGWDLVLDVDSPYLDYSKIYAKLLIEKLESFGIENIGVKFSGSKGFHIIVPWKAFPEEIYGNKTKDMFPDFPRIICEYLSEILQPKLEEEILSSESPRELSRKVGKKEEELIVRKCKSCGREAKKRELVTWICPYCKMERTMIKKNKRIPKCPECKKLLVEKSKEEIYVCEFCNINSKKNPELFEKKERFATEKLIEADLILVSSRHLFRMPYSLHEKTSLSSVVIDKKRISEFQISDADPFKVEIRNFYPEPKKEEAKRLLLQALDWKEQKEREKSLILPFSFEKETSKKEFKRILIPNPDLEIFPPCIKLLLKGIQQDGRKRALFILINFFKALGMDEKEIEKRINEWNTKNYQPLKEGYIRSQFNWYRKNPPRLPPNCDKPNYKELNVCKPDEFCRKIKNPVSYAIQKFLKLKKEKD